MATWQRGLQAALTEILGQPHILRKASAFSALLGKASAQVITSQWVFAEQPLPENRGGHLQSADRKIYAALSV